MDTVDRQHLSCRVELTEGEGGGLGAQVHDTVVSGEHPEVASSVGLHVVAETEVGMVLYERLVVHVHLCQTFDTASPDGMAHAVLDQSVECAEIQSSLVRLMHPWCLLVLRMIQTYDTVLPGADPESSTTVYQQ